MGFKRRNPLSPLNIKETGEIGLYVTYSLSEHDWGALDDKIDRVVGRTHEGGGTGPGGRDLDYWFDTLDEAKKAAERVQKLHARGITVSYDGIDDVQE